MSLYYNSDQLAFKLPKILEYKHNRRLTDITTLETGIDVSEDQNHVTSTCEAEGANDHTDMQAFVFNGQIFRDITSKLEEDRLERKEECLELAGSSKLNSQGGTLRAKTAKQAIRILSRRKITFETTSSFCFLKKRIWYGEYNKTLYFSSNLVLSAAGGK